MSNQQHVLYLRYLAICKELNEKWVGKDDDIREAVINE